MPPRRNRWLDDKHAVWIACRAEWERNQRRWRGGSAVLSELRRFDWESLGRGHYQLRQARATYVPLPELYITTIAGHIFRNPPSFDYGTMGKVERRRGQTTPSMAELVHYNMDGLGQTGSHAHAFWQHSLEQAMALGHIWQLCEAPARAPRTQQDEVDGLHPYLANYSPLQVTNYYEEEGVPMFRIIRVPHRRPRRNPDDPDASLLDNAGTLGYYLLTRRGWTEFGPEYAEGGWWRFDPDGNPMTRPDGSPFNGRWDAAGTGGEIPMWPLYYRRDKGLVATPADERLHAEREAALMAAGADSETWNTGFAAMSRSAITELGAIAVSYMDISSAADFDLWDAAMSLLFLLGVDPDAHNIVVSKMEEGNRILPVQHALGRPDAPTLAQVGLGAEVAAAYDQSMERKLKLGQMIASMEATGTPDASGLSKEAGFTEKMAPRLVATAMNLESAMNTAIPALEQRSAAGFAQLVGSPIETAGVAEMPKDFKIVDVDDAIRDTFTLEKLSGYKSRTLGAQLMTENARRRGFLKSPEDAETVRAEYEESAESAANAADQAARAGAAMGLGAL
jgi:hypothetical protein